MMPVERYRHPFLVCTERPRRTLGEFRKLGVFFEIVQDHINTLASHGTIHCLCRLVFNEGKFHQSLEPESSGKIANFLHVRVILSGEGREMEAGWNQAYRNKMIEKRFIEAAS